MSRFLSVDVISEVSQYDFNIEKMMVVPKHVKLPNIGNQKKDILGLYSILNPFKINLSLIQDTREIGAVASGQARSKIRKSYLK